MGDILKCIALLFIATIGFAIYWILAFKFWLYILEPCI